MSRRGRTIMIALLLSVTSAMILSSPSSAAVDNDPDVDVTITTLSPNVLSKGTAISVGGTVTNNDDHRWGAVQAYLVLPRTPFTTRAQTTTAISNNNSYPKERVVDIGSFAELGDLDAGESRPFMITVPYDQLGVTGAEGIYPVGVQILATDTDGSRSGSSIAQSTIFVPLLDSTTTQVPTSIVWPFLMPSARDGDGTYVEPEGLLASISPGGQLRNLLDLASTTGTNASTVLLDPALLVAADDLATGTNLPASFTVTEEQRADADLFRRDLVTFARAGTSWILDFDRPDALALSQNPDLGGALKTAIDYATSSTLATFQVYGRATSWPTADGVTSTLLSELRRAGKTPVLVSRSSLPDWEPRLGSLVQYATTGGSMPLLVTNARGTGTPGNDTVVALRQRILTDAALGVLERAVDPSSRADAVTVVDPGWDPGTQWASAKLANALTTPFIQSTSVDSMLTRPLGAYQGDVPDTAKADPIGRPQLVAASRIAEESTTLEAVISDSASLNQRLARDVAGVLGVRWRDDREQGLLVAQKIARNARTTLEMISLEAPPSVTLSSSKGGFPLTILNNTDEEIQVGVSIDSSNPALTIDPIESTTIAAGERRTLTVQVDLGSQRTTFLTAQLQTQEGQQIGTATTFKVRSSSIGAVVWAAMAGAGLLVLVSLARRFLRHRTRTSPEPLADDD